MMAVGIDEAARAPAVLVRDGGYLRRSGAEGAGEGGVGIGNRENYFDRAASAEGFRAVVLMLRGFVAEPEFGAIDREAGDDVAIGILEAESFCRSEGRLVKLNSFGTAAN